MKKIILTLIITMLILLTSCSNTLTDNSDSIRKITVYNTTTDMILFDLTDVFTVSRDKQALTVKQADNKTHYIYGYWSAVHIMLMCQAIQRRYIL